MDSHSKADRYVSFNGIDFEGNVRRVLDRLERCRSVDLANRLIAHIDDRRSNTDGVRRDDLLRLHSVVNAVRELSEVCGDAALADLGRPERF